MIPSNFITDFFIELKVRAHERASKKLQNVRRDLQVYRESISGAVETNEYTEGYLEYVKRKIPKLEAREAKLQRRVTALASVIL